MGVTVLAVTTCQLIFVLHFYDPDILRGTHLGNVLGFNLKGKFVFV